MNHPEIHLKSVSVSTVITYNSILNSLENGVYEENFKREYFATAKFRRPFGCYPYYPKAHTKNW